MISIPGGENKQTETRVTVVVWCGGCLGRFLPGTALCGVVGWRGGMWSGGVGLDGDIISRECVYVP